MANYAVELNRTASTSLSVGSLTADATRPRRMKIYYLSLGSEATPADVAVLWQLQRCTAAGTNTGVTPVALDPADAATEQDAGENHTVDVTATAGAILLSIPQNQRTTVVFQTLPEFGIVTPATAANGVAARTPTVNGTLPAVTCTMHFQEQ